MRQYIGERYVPIVKGPYSSSEEYEPLCIVLYNNSSYTSKKYVPAGVAPSDSDYWAKTGDYDATVSDLSTRMSTAESTLSTIAPQVAQLITDMEAVKGRFGRNYHGDLNDLTESGDYYCSSSSTNRPIDLVGIALVGSYESTGNHAYQIYIATASSSNRIFTRVKSSAGGTWSAWAEISGSKITSIQEQTTALSNRFGKLYSGDLDDLQTSGTYYCSTTATNKPQSASAVGQCLVMGQEASDNKHVAQLFVVNSSSQHNEIYLRSKATAESEWTEWSQIYTITP